MLQLDVLPHRGLGTYEGQQAKGGDRRGGIGNEVEARRLHRQRLVGGIDTDHEDDEQVTQVGDG